ncbi:hypothetical protein D3C72_1538250 [compost metagenome]
MIAGAVVVNRGVMPPTPQQLFISRLVVRSMSSARERLFRKAQLVQHTEHSFGVHVLSIMRAAADSEFPVT